MSADPISILKSTTGQPIPLKSVTARGRLDGLVFELSVEQRYQNNDEHNLEAVFTFPLPLRAVLLGFELEIGERKLSAVAVARQEASARYEKAIDEGNAAALIERNDEGLYTVSLGNLLAGETALIRYRYAELLDYHAGYVRLNVPTVIAPRYGDPRDAGLEGPTVPDVDLLTEYPFAITLDLVGLTDATSLHSPSHKIATTAGEGGLTVMLTSKGFLDRDFVLEIAAAAVPAAALVARDGDGYVLLASPTLAPDTGEQRPLTLKLLLDCSGSMAGESIVAAKSAVLSILDRLTPDDCVSLTRFGSRWELISEGLEPADTHTLTPLKALVRRSEADLGGTEMQGALAATLAIPVPRDRQADVILITDGEIYNLTGVRSAAARSGQRVFAIAIGAAPNETLARKLSADTDGACEFASSAADAEAAILRTFKRLRSVPRALATIDWPATPAWTATLPTAVFPGDTLHLFAGFTSMPQGETSLTIRDAAGRGTSLAVPAHTRLTTSDLLPRLAAARRLSALPDEEAKALAVQYQLATRFTSFVVIAERGAGEKAEGLPATVAIPHMLAASWGGVSERLATAEGRHVHASIGSLPSLRPRLTAFSCESLPSRQSRRLGPLDEDDESPSGHNRRKRSPEPDEVLLVISFSEDERLAVISSLASAVTVGRPLPTTLGSLAEDHSVPARVVAALADAIVETNEEESVGVAVFIAMLVARTPGGLSPEVIASIGGEALGSRKHRRLRKVLRTRFEL